MQEAKTDFEEILSGFSNDIEDAIDIAKNVEVEEDINKIAVIGVGRGRIAGKILENYIGAKKEVYVLGDSKLPDFFDSHTLVFVLSYSGDTDNLIDAYRVSLRKGCKIVGISLGGKLQTLCDKQGRDHIKVPFGKDPRAVLPYFFFPMLTVLHNSGMIEDQATYVSDTIKTLKKDMFKEKGEALARRIIGKIPLIYSTKSVYSAGESWKVSINHNAKTHAFFNMFPEVEYSELEGFGDLKGLFYVLIIRDSSDERKLKKDIEKAKDTIKKAGIDVMEISISGGCRLTKLFSAVYIGEWVSYFLKEKDILE